MGLVEFKAFGFGVCSASGLLGLRAPHGLLGGGLQGFRVVRCLGLQSFGAPCFKGLGPHKDDSAST